MHDTVKLARPLTRAADDQVLSSCAEAWLPIFVDLPLSMTRLSESVMSNALRFAHCRLQAQTDHLQALSDCRSLADAARLQTAFASQAFADYQKEAGRVISDVQRALTPDELPV